MRKLNALSFILAIIAGLSLLSLSSRIGADLPDPGARSLHDRLVLRYDALRKE